MTMSKVIETAIKNHCKEREYVDQFKGIKVLSVKFREAVECYGGEMLCRYDVVTAIKAKKYENNRVKFEVCIYDNPTGEKTDTIGVYYNGEYYEA